MQRRGREWLFTRWRASGPSGSPPRRSARRSSAPTPASTGPDAGLGRFDLAVVWTLLHHLRDPARALAALRRVLDGELIVNEPVIAGPDSLRRRPLAELIVSDVAARQPWGAR